MNFKQRRHKTFQPYRVSSIQANFITEHSSVHATCRTLDVHAVSHCFGVQCCFCRFSLFIDV